MRKHLPWILLGICLAGLCGCMANPPSSLQLGKPSMPVAGPVGELSDEEYAAAMDRVEVLRKSGQDWEAALPKVRRGMLVNCWQVEDLKEKQRGYGWCGPSVATGWIPAMRSDNLESLRALAASVRQRHKTIRLIPCYPGGYADGRYRVRALNRREILELARYLEILEVKDAGPGRHGDGKQ